MTAQSEITTPQFRTELIRKLSNIVPDCAVEFIETVSPGIEFLLKDQHGRYRSNIVRIYRNRPHTLDKRALIAAIKRAGIPTHGLPNGF